MQKRIFSGEAVFDGRTLHPPAAVEVAGDGSVVATTPAREGSAEAGWIIPGFVNAHCHLELSFLKGALPRGTGLPRFLEGVMTLRGEATGDQEGAARQAAAELWEGGIAGVGDICNTTGALEAKRGSRLRVHSFVEVLGVRNEGAESRMAGALSVLDAHRAAGLRAGLTAHAPYSCAPELLQRLNSATAGGIISVHNGETAAERLLFEKGAGPFMDFYRRTGLYPNSVPLAGGSALMYWLGHFREGQTVLLVHNTFTTEEDVDRAADHAARYGLRLFWVLCPGANRFIEEAWPPAPMLLRKGCRIALGTDSLASNDVLDIGRELQLLQAAFPEIPLTTLLQWATFNGAEALGFPELGRMEPGSSPGLLRFHPQSFEVERLC